MSKSNTKPRAKKPSKPEYHCEICNKTIAGSSYNFKYHLFQHRAIKPRFECKYCYKQYYRSDEYYRHVKIHSGGHKYFTCDYCDRNFIDKRNLISHLRIHDDTINHKLYKCLACGISYCEDRLLKHHVRKMHFNLQAKEEAHLKKTVNETWIEKVKDTKVCVEMTKKNNNVITIKKCTEDLPLNKEMETQDLSSVYASTQYSQVICDYCNKQMLKKSLLSHIREKHFDVRKFTCEECKRSFRRHYQMVNHICGKPTRRNKRVTGLVNPPCEKRMVKTRF